MAISYGQQYLPYTSKGQSPVSPEEESKWNYVRGPTQSPVSPVKGSYWSIKRFPTRVRRVKQDVSTKGSEHGRTHSIVDSLFTNADEKRMGITSHMTDSSANTDPESRVSRSRAFRRCLIPGWSESVPEGEKWYHFLIKGTHTLFAVVIPVILLLPLVLLRRVRFKLDTDTGDYFAVSAIQAWVAPSGEG
jgi:hypothetical protein